MKKALLIGASLVVSLGTAAQTLNVVVGEVTYKIPAFQAGSMDYPIYNRYSVKTSYKVTIFFHYICLGMYIIQ